jgi:hypothetical protein
MRIGRTKTGGIILPWWTISLVVFVLLAIYSARDPQSWYRLDYVEVTDRFLVPGDWKTRVLEVDREILQPFTARYQVDEFAILKNGWLRVKSCLAPTSLNYVPTAALPKPITMAWWVYGECNGVLDSQVDDRGEFVLCTSVHIQIIPWLPMFTRQSVPTCTEPYRGRAILG